MERQLDSLAGVGSPDARIYIAKKTGKIEYARLLKGQGDSLGVIATKTGIPNTSLHRYLTDTDRETGMGASA